ncbi:pheromone A receptor-domain-containing protein [Lentinula aciculospora]|uniref:Pheromone A receptor-domain-containing protein n=1 Tax=Lentinula aciculospora TaxID=153920 RepID=A0A9W9ADD3_9AGAR|nr:pheromone A receptor-domain-containing protein [Lentinula aciculospora]
MAWMGLACLFLSINSFLWNSTTSNFAPVWCDIFGANAAISSVSLCINLRLWLIASDRVRTLEKRCTFFVELFLGLGIPVLEIVFQYLVQYRRFDIYEGFGCHATSDNVLLMYLLLLAPQFLLGIASMTFFVLAFVAYHRMYKYMLDTQNSPTFHRRTTFSASFLWFLALGGITILCSIAYTAFVVYFNATAHTSTFTLWYSWEITHFGIKNVNVYNEKEWRGDMMTEFLLEANRWIFVGLSLLFFMFFGLTREARRRYKTLFGRGGRGKWKFEIEKSMVQASDRGIVHYAGEDEESTEGSTSTFVSTSKVHAIISKPQLVVPTTINVLPEDPFRLDNPYPKHIYDKKTEGQPVKKFVTSSSIEFRTEDDSAMAALKSGDLVMTTLPIKPSSAAPLSSLSNTSIASSTSTSDRMAAPEATASPFLLIPTPPSAYSPNREPSTTPVQLQLTFASGSSMLHTSSIPLSFPSVSSVSTTRGRRNSTGPHGGHMQRPLPRRSLSRSFTASATSPPTGPLPEPPSDVPSRPTTIRDFQPYIMNTSSKRGSGSLEFPPLDSVPATSAAAVDFLVHHGRISSLNRPMEGHFVPADVRFPVGKPF